MLLTANPLTVVLLWGGWSWWYRADFPLPQVSGTTVAGIDLGWLNRRLIERSQQLTCWKVQWETSNLQIEGTTWENPDCGFQLVFGRNGRVSLKTLPAEKHSPEFTLKGAISNAEITAFAEWIEGATFQFLPNTVWPEKPLEVYFDPAIGIVTQNPNLRMPDTEYDAFLTYMGGRLSVVLFHRREKFLCEDAPFFFERAD